MATRTVSGQHVLPSEGRATESPETRARVDTTRCVTAGTSEEYRNAFWVALTGVRDEVTSDGAKKLAQHYVGGNSGIDRAYGPLPDDGSVMPPSDASTPPSSVSTMDDYMRRAAEMNLRKAGADKTVCFYLVRRMEE